MSQELKNGLWAKITRNMSLANISIIATILVAVLATLDRGGYMLVNTLVEGGMIALMSMGLALTLGVLNIPMFAHGEFFMIGTLVGYYVFTPLSSYMTSHPESYLVFWGPIITILAAAVAGAIAGVIVELFIFRQLRKRSRENWVMNSFLLTVGLSVVLINGHQLFFGADFKGIVGYYHGSPLTILGVYISRDRCFASIVAVLVVALFWYFITHTRIGRAIRSVSQDETGALMVGIPINAILMLTMALSCALAAVAGAGLLFMYPSYPTVGLMPLYMAWFVVILAGLGNVMGAVMCSFMVALLRVLTITYIGSGWDLVFPSILIILILIFKPSGIFGTEVRGVLDK